MIANTSRIWIRDMSTFVLGAVSFLTFIWMYVGLYTQYQLAADDYSTIDWYNSFGSIGAGFHLYQTWTGNFFMAIIQTFVIGTMHQHFGFYGLVLILSLCFSFYIFLQTLLKFYDVSINLPNILTVSAILTITLFFAAIDITQNWFWMVGSIVYITPIILLMLGCSQLLHHKISGNLFSGFVGFFLVLVFGNATQNYVISFSIAVGIFVIILSKSYKIIWKDHFFLLLTSAIVLGLFINVMSPGNFVRLNAEKLSRINQLKPPFLMELIRSQLWTWRVILTKLPYILGGVLPIIYLMQKQVKLIPTFILNRLIIASLFSTTLSSVINSIIMIKVTNWGVHSRTMTLIEIMAIVTVFFIGVRIYRFMRFDGLVQTVFYAVCLLCILVFTYLSGRTFQTQYPILQKYSRESKERLRAIEIKNHNLGGNNILELPPLPSSGILYSSEIDTSRNNYINHDMKKALKLSFEIKRIE